MDTKKAASFRNISVLKKLSSKFSFPPCFRKSIFGIRKKEKLPRPFETASLLAPYLCLLYELLHVFFTCSASYVQTARSMFLRHSVSYLFFRYAKPFPASESFSALPFHRWRKRRTASRISSNFSNNSLIRFLFKS